MLGDASPLIETAIGLVFLWFLAATLCSGVVELVSSMFSFRASSLWRTLDQALGKPAKAPNVAAVSAAKMARKVEPAPGSTLAKFVEHVPGVTAGETKRVKEIDPKVAADALVATREENTNEFADTQLGKLVADLPPSVRDDADELRKWFERWFDGAMSTLSATFRRNIRWWTVVASVLIVGILGLESIGFAQRLYDQPAQQAVITAQAEAAVTAGEDAKNCKDTSTKGRFNCAKDTVDELSGLKVSVWEIPADQRPAVLRIILGFLVTVAAIAFGAPFWFDVMRRLSGLRKVSTTTPPAS